MKADLVFQVSVSLLLEKNIVKNFTCCLSRLRCSRKINIFSRLDTARVFASKVQSFTLCYSPDTEPHVCVCVCVSTCPYRDYSKHRIICCCCCVYVRVCVIYLWNTIPITSRYMSGLFYEPGKKHDDFLTWVPLVVVFLTGDIWYVIKFRILYRTCIYEHVTLCMFWRKYCIRLCSYL